MWKTLRRTSPFPFALLALVDASQPQQTPVNSPFSGPITALTSPASEGSAQPNLAADRNGRVWLSWLESRSGGGHRLQLASLRDTTWSPTVTIAEGTDFLANWADFPSIFLTSTGTLAAHWLQRGIGTPYGIQLRTSSDDGRTWTRPETPHRDTAAGEFGFVSFFEAPGAGLGLVWLDGRRPAKRAGQEAHTDSGMAVRAALVKNGMPGEQAVVDPQVCECCQTSAARTSDGVVVAYRDRSDASIRDISVARFANGRWSAPSNVHGDNWEINGCPVNGPVVTALGDTVAVTWFTMAGGTPHVKVAFSSDGGRQFASPVQADANVTFGRLGMVMPDPDRVLVSSIERSNAGVELVVRQVTRDGPAGPAVVVAPSTSDRSSGFARMALTGKRVVLAWTEVGRAPTRVRVASAMLR
jgi:hypothetical protein